MYGPGESGEGRCWPQRYSLVALWFAVTIPGIVGVIGWLVERTGSFDRSFVLAAGMFVLGAAVWQVLARTESVES